MTSVDSARIEPAFAPYGDAAESLAKTGFTSENGSLLNIFTTLAHHPRLLRRFNALGGLYVTHGLLPARLRELVILRTAWRTSCEYEWGQHVIIGRNVGLSDEEIVRVTHSTDSTDLWSPADSLVLNIADELLDSVDVNEGTWGVAISMWSDAELLELVTLVGFYRMTAGLLNAVRVQREDALPGWPDEDGRL